MLLIPHYVGPSNIEGVGLFSPQDIAEGEVIYRFDYRFVMVISDAEIKEMTKPQQDMILKYSYRGRGAERMTGAVYFCADDSRFFNHSDDPNTRWVVPGDCYIATRAIPANTEITCDYREFTEPGDWAAEVV